MCYTTAKKDLLAYTFRSAHVIFRIIIFAVFKANKRTWLIIAWLIIIALEGLLAT